MLYELNQNMLHAQIVGIDAVKRAGVAVKQGVKEFFTDEEGDTNIIAVILLLVIVIALAVMFRDNIGELAKGMFNKVFEDAGGSGTEATDISGGDTFFKSGN